MSNSLTSLHKLPQRLIAPLGKSRARLKKFTRRADFLAASGISFANGVVGDHLEARNSPLALGLELRYGGQTLERGTASIRSAYPAPTSKIVILSHGLVMNDGQWGLYARRWFGSSERDYGWLLQRDAGYTPVYSRYNSGRHISINGRALADRLEQLCQDWPVDVEEIVLLGHSMGGMVSRSAAHYGHTRKQQWASKLRSVVTLGSPIHGAPLAKLGNHAAVGVQQLIPRNLITEALQGLSAGIHDLRYSYLRDEDWRWTDQRALTSGFQGHPELPKHAKLYCVSSVLGNSPQSLWARRIGDLLVNVDSATPSDAVAAGLLEQPSHMRVFTGINHLELLGHPAVYKQLRHWIAKRQ